MQGNVNIPDSTITSALTFRNLVLMNMRALTNFPYIEKDFDALTDYELLCLVVKYLNDVIANQNEQNDSITNMYNAFLALQTYVNNTKDTLEDAFNELDNYVRNYFENLDVQEEINNKLDEMVKDGTMVEIISQYFQNVAKIYDTVSAMKSSTSLFDGAYVKTLGFRTIGDGGSAYYKISNIGDETPNEMDVIAIGTTLKATFIQTEKAIRPEQVGAYSDGSVDSLAYINRAIEINPEYVILDGRYTISAPLTLTTLTNAYITGHGVLINESDYGLVLDGCGWCNIENIRISAPNGLKVTATSGAVQYLHFRDLRIVGDNTSLSNGICIEAPNNFNNECVYENCLISGFYRGIYINNGDKTYDCAAHKFITCSTENCNVGQWIIAADYITFLMCRHVEAGSLRWITEGVCNQLLIIGGVVSNNAANSVTFSTDTSGLIVGRVRMGGVYFNNPSRPFTIVGGKIIPDANTTTDEYASLDTDNTLPSASYGAVYRAGRCYNTTSTTTTNLDTNYYGGRGKMNEFMMRLGGGSHKIITIGTKSFDINNTTASDRLILFKWYPNAGWTVTELATSLS